MNTLFSPRTKGRFALAALVVAGLLSGCSTMGEKVPVAPTRDALTTAYKEAFPDDSAWGTPAIVRDGQVGVVLIETSEAPDEVQNKRITLELTYGSTYRDLAFTLSTLGVPLSASDDALLDKKLPLVKWTGRLGGYLRALSGASDLHFIWQGTAYFLETTDRYVVSAVQDDDFLSSVASDLDKLGIKAARSDYAGMMVVKAKPSEAALLKTYLARASKNAAVVSLQVGVVNVQLTNGRNVGVSWDKLNLALGKHAAALNPLVSGTTTTTDPTSSTSATAAASTGYGAQAVFSGMSGTTRLVTNGLALSSVVNFLSTYGEATTLQNTLLTTVAGKEVALTSAVNIPYVASIGVTTSTGTSTTTGSTTTSSATAPIGTTTTSTAKSGVTVKMKPRYDNDANLVSLDLNLEVSAVLNQNQLSAGNQIGTLTQPTTQDQTFNASLRLRPGETAVVGGVRYLSTQTGWSGPAIAGLEATSKNNTNAVNEMFIVVRPTIRLAGKALETQPHD